MYISDVKREHLGLTIHLKASLYPKFSSKAIRNYVLTGKTCIFFTLSYHLGSRPCASIRHLCLAEASLRPTCLPSSLMQPINHFLSFPQGLFSTTFFCNAIFTRSSLFILCICPESAKSRFLASTSHITDLEFPPNTFILKSRGPSSFIFVVSYQMAVVDTI